MIIFDNWSRIIDLLQQSMENTVEFCWRKKQRDLFLIAVSYSRLLWMQSPGRLNFARWGSRWEKRDEAIAIANSPDVPRPLMHRSRTRGSYLYKCLRHTADRQTNFRESPVWVTNRLSEESQIRVLSIPPKRHRRNGHRRSPLNSHVFRVKGQDDVAPSPTQLNLWQPDVDNVW